MCALANTRAAAPACGINARVARASSPAGNGSRTSISVARAPPSPAAANRGLRARQTESLGQASTQMAQVSVLQEQVYGEAVVSLSFAVGEVRSR